MVSAGGRSGGRMEAVGRTRRGESAGLEPRGRERSKSRAKWKQVAYQWRGRCGQGIQRPVFHAVFAVDRILFSRREAAPTAQNVCRPPADGAALLHSWRAAGVSPLMRDPSAG